MRRCALVISGASDVLIEGAVYISLLMFHILMDGCIVTVRECMRFMFCLVGVNARFLMCSDM